MKIIKIGLKFIAFIVLLPLLYVLVSLITSSITINNEDKINLNKTIYLNTNGVQLDIIIPKNYLSQDLTEDLHYNENDIFLAFGWGDEEFYLNTPNWSDLKISTAVNAVFLDSPTLIHVTRYNQELSDWVEVRINNKELKNLNSYISENFHYDDNGNKVILENGGYSYRDDFYKAKGNYSLFNTCIHGLIKLLKRVD
jgi:uncharacterized protein (TIGR02117 family)